MDDIIGDEDYNLQQALEAMAGNAQDAVPSSSTTKSSSIRGGPSEPISKTISRWSTVFDLNPDKAIDLIQTHRASLTRPRITPEHWNLIRAEKEGQGYDRQAYEYELSLAQKRAAVSDPVPGDGGGGGGSGSNVTYLVESDEVLELESKLRDIVGADGPLDVVSGSSVEEGRSVKLCCMNETGKAKLLRWAVEEGQGYEPVILTDPRSLR